ncbi:hypothetical protein U8527_00095 [Kordia algicida OT-1]|uniref:Uncharacterized protein n=1 Tax=Kordia algicida OT-1 TaxID=391587 RepID=A9DQS2_9FLAO|nr:hypothetical protein [Kordia algicida]EDP96687.1 hypothetical protein KAOT1_16028 [Kordia algicida OT-1]
MLPATTTTTPCVHCAPFAKKKFSSQEDFIAFEKELEAKCVDGTFIRIVNADETEMPSWQSTYQCTFCETDWELAIPEGKMRGYFLPTDQVSQPQQNNNNYYFNMKSSKRSPNCGCCLGMIFLLILLILYILWQFVDFLFDLIF